MVNYTIKRLSYSNFKYVSADSIAAFEFPNSSAVGSLTILGGPNGYGKSTLFDAIELLLTGEIKAFREDMRSRGKDNYSILANDPKRPMSFSADFQANDGKLLCVKRQLTFSTEGSIDQLTIDGKAANTDELQTLLKFNNNLFDLGIYISQRESLSFLQNKYKTRGQEVADIIDVSFIQEKIELLQGVRECLLERLHKHQEPLSGKLRELNDLVLSLQKQVEMQSEINMQPVYERLFSDSEYDFDKKDIDISCSFDSLVEVVEDLKIFSKNFEGYQNESFNELIDTLITWNQNDYFALYNRSNIKLIKDNEKKLNDLNFIQRAANELKNGKYPLICSIYSDFGVDNTLVKKLQDSTNQVQIIEKQLGASEAALQKIIDSRTSFILTYAEQRKKAGLEVNTCPLCGTKVDDLLEAIKIAEEELRQGASSLQERLSTLKKEQNDAGNAILEYFEEILHANQSLLLLQNNLDRVKDLDTKQLEMSLKEVGIDSFQSLSPNFSMDETILSFV